MIEEVLTIPSDDSIADTSATVLAGIIPGNRKRLVQAAQQLTLEHFVDKQHHDLFMLLKRYYDRTTEVLLRKTMTHTMVANGWEATRVLAMEQLYDKLGAEAVGNGEFAWAMYSLKDALSKKKTGEALTEAFEVLETGVQVGPENRDRFPGKPLGTTQRGAEAAREYAAHQLYIIERMGEIDAAPEGDIRFEHDRALQDYAERKFGSSKHSVLTGIKCIDQNLGGFQNGELILFAAYTGQGKSMFATQTAWYNAFGVVEVDPESHGRDVFFATSETIRMQVMRRIWARHSRLKQFDLPNGLNSQHIKDGKLSPAHEKVFSNVLEDLKYNPRYGNLNIVQMPRNADLRWLEQRLREFGRENDVALCVSDYLALVKPARQRQGKREEYDEIINDAKLIATTFGDGRGVPFLSPWAVKQDAFERAVYGGGKESGSSTTKGPTMSYGLSCLAETSVAEKSADQIITGLRLEAEPDVMRLQFQKTRDGDLPANQSVKVDFRSTYMGDKDGAMTTAIHQTTGIPSDELDGILDGA